MLEWEKSKEKSRSLALDTAFLFSPLKRGFPGLLLNSTIPGLSPTSSQAVPTGPPRPGPGAHLHVVLAAPFPLCCHSPGAGGLLTTFPPPTVCQPTDGRASVLLTELTLLRSPSRETLTWESSSRTSASSFLSLSFSDCSTRGHSGSICPLHPLCDFHL